MTAIRNVPGTDANARLFEGLTHATRRKILRILERRGEAMSVGDLVDRLSTPPGVQAGDGARASTEEVRTRLIHRHLPKLVESGLITPVDDGTVELAGHPALETAVVRELLAADDRREPTAAVLADDRRRTLLRVVESSDGPISRETLARELAATADPSESRVRDVGLRLHHRHLPSLDRAGLVAYDYEAGTAEYTGSRAVTTFLREFQ